MSRTRRSLTAVAAGAAALALALAGCSGGSKNNSTDGAGSGGDTNASAGQPLRVFAGAQTPITRNFNPYTPDTALHGTYGPIYEPLFFFNQVSDAAPIGLIGDSFSFSEDGKVLTVKIKPGQKWSDGSPLTTDDIVFSFTYSTAKESLLVSAEATDDTTVVLTYSEPRFTAASIILGNTSMVPKAVWEKISSPQGETNDEPVGSGPYVVDSFSDATYTLKANDNYRDGAPAVTEVQYIGIDSNQASEDLLKTGQLDWVGQFIANPDAVTQATGGRIETLNTQLDPTVIMTCANVDLGCSGPQTDVAVRQALNVAIDRTGIREKAFADLAGVANPAMALLPRDEKWVANAADKESPQSANAEEAGKILEAAGYTKGADGFYGKDGKAIEIDLFSPDGWTDYNDAAKLITESAAKAGIQIKNRTVSDAEYWGPVYDGQFQMALYGLSQSLVPDPFSNYERYFSTPSTAPVGESPTKGENLSRYSNPTVDAAVLAAGGTQDEAAKKDAYTTIQAEIARDLPYIPVVLNASQAFFDTQNFTGWPTKDDPYAVPLPYVGTASAVVLTHLKPVAK